jgi:lipoprotein signal peptidase
LKSPARHLVQLSRIALLVAIGDFATKAAAAAFVGGEPTVFNEWLHFAVVNNDQGAFGLSVGSYTWQLNLALTLSAIALMLSVSRDLARIDSMAPRALGLIVGGAIGNLASLITSPHGVVDFIAISFSSASSLVLNVADVAAYAGLAMMLRTGFLIVHRIRTDVPVTSRAARRDAPRVLQFALSDREVDLPVHRDTPDSRWIDAQITGDIIRPASHERPTGDVERPKEPLLEKRNRLPATDERLR